jgi:hypothetical protein
MPALITFRMHPLQHRRLAELLEARPRHPKAYLARHHRGLAKLIRRRLQRGEATIAEDAAERFAKAKRVIRGWVPPKLLEASDFRLYDLFGVPWPQICEIPIPTWPGPLRADLSPAERERALRVGRVGGRSAGAR